MEASLRDLLERLDGIAAGTARSHDTPTHLVEEVKEVLEHLASDELPAASAVFLSKDHPGALHHLEDARAMSSNKPSAAANAGRAKLFELIAWYLTRLDAEAVEPYAEAVMRECLRTFRTERGTQKTVKAAALAPLASLLRLGATRLSRDETRALACELREDYERHTANTARVKGMILSVIAAMHDCGVSASAPDGPLSREREEEEEEEEEEDEDFPSRRNRTAGSKPAPDPRWLLRVGLATATGGGASTSATLVAEAFDAVGSALAALEREKSATPSASPLDDDARRRIASATLDALALPGGGQRSDVTRAALRMVAAHARALAAPPGVLSLASEYFKALLLCRTSGNKNIRQAASPATDAFLSATADALADASTAPEAEREAVWTRLSEDALALIDARDTKAKERTVAVRAVGKLARAGFAVGGFGAPSGFDPDAMLARIARWTSSDYSFSDGSNDFDRRYEAMERQTAVLGAYADLLVARGAGARVPQTALASLARVARWAWEHYFVAGERAREDTRARLAEAFEALAFRGGITTLTGVLGSISRSLVALSLRVAPPDPIDSAAFRAAPEPLWPKYVDLWTQLMRGGDAESREPRGTRACATYDAFVRETLQLCQTLQLRVVPAARAVPAASEARGDDEHRDEDDATTRALALELGEGVAAENPGDMQTFLCLVDLFCAVIAGAPARHVQRWLTTLIENVAALVAAHPLLSGFYKIARVALVAADDAGVFEQTDASHSDSASFDAFAAKETCRAFLLDVLAGAERLSDELRAAALQLLLSAPAGLLSARELAPALRDALAVGAHHPPLAHAALDVLDRWAGTRGTLARSSGTHDTQNGNGSHRREPTRHRARDDREEIRALLPSMARSLRAYVDRRGASEKTDAGGDASFDAENLASGLNAGDAYRSARRAAESARAADRSAEPEHDIDTRVARVLGAVGGAAHALIDDDDRRARSSGASASASSSTLWDFERRVSLDVEVGENARVTIWLDRMLPRAAHCALSSTDRAAKVAAAEFLHAATLLMVGRNARAFAPEGGDHAREATPFHKIYRRLFPAVLELAIDQEPVCRQLFSALATQLVRWFTRNQAREAAETVALLDAVVEGLAGDPARRDAEAETETPFQKTASPGTLPGKLSGGAAARRRDLCASLAAECLKWSVRSVPSGDLRGGGRGAPRRGGAGPGDGVGQSVAVNVSSLLRRLFAFQTHPDPSKRLGAATALRLCLAELRMFPEHDEAHALEILETALRSLRLAERDPPGAGAAEAGALLARAATRACARHAVALCRTDPKDKTKDKTASRGGSFGSLPRLVSWLFADGVARAETRARLESQLAFGALVQRTPGYVSPRAWVAAARAKVQGTQGNRSSGIGPGFDGGDSDDFTNSAEPFWPFRVRAFAPEPEALAADADEADVFSATRDATRGDVVADTARARTTLRLELAEAWMRGVVATLHWARWALERGLVALEDLLPESDEKGKERSVDHPLVAAAYFLRHSVPSALRGTADNDAEARRSVSSSSPAARAWRKARVRLSVQILVLAELAAREKSGVGAFFEALNGGADASEASDEGPSKADPALSQLDQPSRGGVARLACAAALAPETLGADVAGGRMDDVNQLAGASARFLAPTMGDASASPELAPLRGVARATLRHALAYHPRFDLGAADARSAEGLRAARRLAAGYRALANVNLLRPLLPPQTPRRTSGAETESATVPKSSQAHEMSRARLARRLLLAARALGPEASPAQVDAGREWVTLAAHIGASPEFLVRLALGDAEAVSEARALDASPVSASSSPSRAFSTDAILGETFLQTFRKDVVAAVRWNFPACVEVLVRRVVDGGDGETAALQLLFAALDAPADGAATSFVETKILEALAPHLGTLASLADRSTVKRARFFEKKRRREDSEDERKSGSDSEPEPETHERFDERRRACVELARRAVALDAACAGTGPGRGRVLFPERRSSEGDAPGDVLARAVASVACSDAEAFTGDDVGPAQREALAAFPALLAAGGVAAGVAAAAGARLARLLRDSGASRAAAGSADGAAFAAARAGILHAAATPFPGYEAHAADTLAAVVAVVADDADGGAAALAATAARFDRLAAECVQPSAWPAEALAAAAWALASDAAAHVDERVVAGASALPSLAADARSEAAVGAFFATRVETMLAMLDPEAAARALASGETSPGAVVAGARVAYAALAAMYERCSKETVAAGPGAAVAALNAAVSRRAALDLGGGGAVGVAAAFAAKARDEWTRRRGLEGFHAIGSPTSEMEVDDHRSGADRDIRDDGAPDVLPEDAVVAARRGAFGAFAALVARTQTKAKFYEKLFEGGAARWNALAGGGDAPLPLEGESGYAGESGYVGYVACSRFVPESGMPEADASASPRFGNRLDETVPADPSLAFTLSATLSAGDPTLARAPGAQRTPKTSPRLRGSAGSDSEGTPFGATRASPGEPTDGFRTPSASRRRSRGASRERGDANAFEPSDEGPTDALERHPVAEAAFVALERAASGAVSDIRSLRDIVNASEENEDGDWTASVETPRVFKLIASLAADPGAAPRARACVVKAVLRLHRREMAVAEREAALKEAAAKEAARLAKAGDDVEVEVVAEKSLEEVEREKLRRAREEGDYLDLTSSQVETVTTPPEREVAEKKSRGRQACPFPRSTLAAHARVMLPGVLRGVLDVSRDAGCHVLHATLREAAVAALECDVAWRDFQFETENANEKEKSPFAAVQELAARVITASPSRNAHTLRQNVALAVALARRLVESAGLRTLETEGAGAADAADAAAARALRPALDAAVDLMAADLSKPAPGASPPGTRSLSRADAEYGRTARLCGVQIVGALANSGVLDLGGEAPVIRYVAETRTSARDENENGVAAKHSPKPISPGFTVTGWTSEFLCLGATTCLMEAGSTSGRPLHAAAASLLGLALAQRRAALARNRRCASAGAEEEEEAVDAAASERAFETAEPRWCATLRRRLRALYDRGPQDAFATAAERLARRDPEWLATSADGAVLAQLHQLFPRLHGEPRFVAVRALALVAAADAARGAAFAERALTSSVDGLEALLSTRDAQVHALAMRALADALPGVAEEHRRWPRGKKMDLDAWRRAAARAERSLWRATGAARDAHVAFCAALAKAAPSLADLPAVRAPLLRAVVDGRPGGEDKARRDVALEYWNARLPGVTEMTAERTGAGGDATSRDADVSDLQKVSNPFGRRVRAALGVLPTGASARAGGTRASDGRESLAEETRATAKGWLAATCDVVLSVPRARRASFHAPLCDADLAKCEFRDAVVDVAWQGASLPMAPLFSTQAALSTQATQASAHGAFGSIAGTHMSHGTAQLASSASLASAPGGAPGVLATPAMNVADGATFAAQFGGASLTERSTGDFAGDFFGAVVGATQAELPPWLRGSSGSSGAGADADAFPDAFPKTHYAGTLGTNTRRRVVVGGGGPAADADAAAFSKASAAERRRRFERERALGRRRAVKLVRQYRAGELPDVRAVTPAALLDPLAALARRDAETASALLTALLDAALESADAAERALGGGSVGEKRKATETYDAETTNAETTNAKTSSSRSSLRDGVRDAIAALLPAASADETLAAWALRAAAADPEARFDADAVRAAAFDGGCLGSGVLALEARALHEARDDTKLHEISHSLVPSAEHRRRDAEVSLPKEKESSAESSGAVWDALAALHRASGDDVAARLCLTRAFDGLEASDARAARTRAALTAQIEGDASSARDIYDALLREDADETSETPDAIPSAETPAFDAAARSRRSRRSRRLWFRERARCSQRLGDWDELALDIAEAVPPPWSVERLRAGSDAGDGERAIPGAAAGGDALCFATRALARRAVERRFDHSLRSFSEEDAFLMEKNPETTRLESLDGSLDAILAHVACAPAGGGDPVAAELGVELATVLMARGLEDAVVARVAAVRARFRERWAATPAAATFARRALLQPLQAATELEEVVGAVRACRADAQRRVVETNENENAPLASVMENVTERWSRRWPSDARDPPEAWERVEWVRRAATRAFPLAVPRPAAEAWSASLASPRALRREVASLVRAAKGMRRAGEMHSAYDRLARAKSLLTEGGRLAPADDSWLVQKAVVKLRLAQADAPRAFGVDGARAARREEDQRRASLLRGVLRSLRRVREEGSLSAYPEAEAEAAACVGALASRLARLEAGANESEGPSGHTGDLPTLACVEYARAATLARRRAETPSQIFISATRGNQSGDGAVDGDDAIDERTNAARAAAKASLRFASHCEATLCAREASSALGEERLELDWNSMIGAPDDTAAAAFHPKGLEPTLARHALLALAGGAGARARHLVPRVLASLRGDDSSTAAATAAEFTRLAPRVPSWLFLEWLPQLYSLLDTPGPGGDAALAVVESLASTYPSAAYAEHRVARAEFSRVGAARCARRVDATLVSPAGEAFARAVTLLDFPAQRLAWWRAHVKLLVAGAAASAAGGGAAEAVTRAAAEAAFGAAEAAVRDVGEPDEPHLGALNRRFAQLAKGPLSRAISEARRKLPRSASEACKALVANFADAEKTIGERWRSSSGAAATEARPRLALAHFSRWFAAFDGSGVMDACHTENPTENPADADWAHTRVRRFRGGVEIPGQYDAPAGPPRVEEHALLVGFEPEVAVFASKQRPKKICLRGSDGREYVFIAKGSEDLRQDDRVERLFAAMDGLFAADPASKRRGLHARTFHVAPLSRRAGLLEYVAGTTPMLEALGARTKLGDAVGAKHQHWVKAQAMHPSIHPEKDRPGEERKTGGGDYSRRRRTPGAKLSAPSSGAVSAAHFLEAMATTPRADARTALASLRRRAAAASSPAASREKPALRRALLRAAGSPEAFLAFRSRFAASVAAGSMCGWVAGVGDRHLQNILLDTTTGSVVHIDFGYAFGTATSALPIPELAPFRLTDAILGGLAPNDALGALRGDMVIAMRALRGGAALLRGVADAFLRSPLADWRREAAQARVKAGRALDRDVLQDEKRDAADALEEEARALRSARVGAAGGENITGEEARHVELKVAHAFCKLELGNPGVLALMQCDAKHSGRAHWRGLREMVLGAPAEGDDDAAARGAAARRAAGDALRCDSVEQQVACLLELATDPLVLATSWSGWRPWL